MYKKIFILVAILIIIILGFYYFAPTKTKQTQTLEDINKNVDKITYTNSSAELISVDSPLPFSTVGKEFNVLGKAKGVWFFEGSFPITVLDKDGKVLVDTFTTAKGEWMTENFVSFSSMVKIPKTYSGPATIIFKKDNPSGEAKLDASIAFPINIQ